MDNFGVPKKINRHVLKALYYMNDCGIEKPELAEICELVEISMKNNVPVRDLPGVVRQSLQNMAHLGVIEKVGMNFHVKNVRRLPPIPKNLDPKVFRNNNRHGEVYRLDPNVRRRRWESEDSVSGNEMEKARKRFRSSRPLNRSGQPVTLPNVRTSYKKHIQNAEMEQTYLSFSGQEIHEQSDCSSKNEFIEDISPKASEHEKTADKNERLFVTNNSEEQEEKVNSKSEPDPEEVITKELSVPELQTAAENTDDAVGRSKEPENVTSKIE